MNKWFVSSEFSRKLFTWEFNQNWCTITFKYTPHYKREVYSTLSNYDITAHKRIAPL